MRTFHFWRCEETGICLCDWNLYPTTPAPTRRMRSSPPPLERWDRALPRERRMIRPRRLNFDHVAAPSPESGSRLNPIDLTIDDHQHVNPIASTSEDSVRVLRPRRLQINYTYAPNYLLAEQYEYFERLT